MYTVNAAKFGELIDSALRNREKPLKCVTELQYASQLRNFHRHIGNRHPLKMSHREVVDYVRAIPSEWARRRAVSALGLLYKLLGRDAVAEALAAAGFSRPDRVQLRDVAEQLRKAGWALGEMRALRWCDVRDRLIQASSRKPSALREPARSALRRLLCKRYPRSDRLLGDGVTALVFAGEDLDAAAPRAHRGR